MLDIRFDGIVVLFYFLPFNLQIFYLPLEIQDRLNLLILLVNLTCFMFQRLALPYGLLLNSILQFLQDIFHLH